jgi:hypothetical protein
MQRSGYVDERSVKRRRRAVERNLSTTLRGFQDHPSEKLPYDSELIVVDHPITIMPFFDAHFWPVDIVEPSPAYWIYLQILSELQPDYVVNGGDSFDGAAISRHPPRSYSDLDYPSVQEELQANQQLLGFIEAEAGDAEFLWTPGNHCYRFEKKLAADAPQFNGVPGFSLPEHFPKWKFAHRWACDATLMIIHKWKGGVHAARNNALNAGISVASGHLHHLYVRPVTFAFNRTVLGIEGGTLADPNGPQFRYVDGPPDWQMGFPIIYVDGQDVRAEEVRVQDGKALWRGKWWKG